MQINALNDVIAKEAIIEAQSSTKSTNNSVSTGSETTTTSNSSSGYSWLDETYNLLFGSSKTTSALSGVNWSKWSQYSNLKNTDMSANLASSGRSSLPTSLSLSSWKDVVTSVGYSYDDIPSGLTGSMSDMRSWIEQNCSTSDTEDTTT